ncbi:glycosyltransferase family 24 protein [Lentinus tigrinus ALCF2SS1-7]|uniref:Glycosyltransferase family 24 protein n=1 Tax=Lentinus tigrinus ALCF2SS1-6 TaxID=1328759 RepID=A0A5C2S9K2_9APHY|nr:glycosyltransferase family 24 protein [Lentinus tigrinus ALCF2SS1-6]RPD70920.1 glycosyltransferase family 24 protein [Lentinus tigrinus ALCF2SS1-7]
MLRALVPLLAWPLLHTAAGKPPVNVELRTSWPSTPILLESLESVAIEEPGAFFPLLDAVTNPETFKDHPSPQDAHQHVFDTALALDYLAEPGAYVAAEMHVALHSASPKLEAFYQYYNDHHAARREDSEGCGSWVDWYGEVVCDAKALSRFVETESLDAPETAIDNTTSFAHASPKLLPFDHVLPDPSRLLELPPRVAVLYAQVNSANFRDLHSYLYAAVHSPTPRLTYVFRPIPPTNRDPAVRTYLSGYGVALDLKKTDYLAVDDRLQGGAGTTDDTAAAAQADEPDPIVTLLQQYPMDESVDVTVPLTEQELKEIDLQAAQLIYDAEDKLAALKHLAQNFPRYAGALARRVSVEQELVDELAANQPRARGGVNVAWLNGVTLDEKDINPFSLLRLIRKERNIMLSLMSLGLSSEQAIELLTHMTIAKAQSESGALDGLFDASDRAEGGGVIGWLNDFETDERYSMWGGNLKIILRPMYPGQFPTLKLNLFNIVLAVDLSQLSSIDFIASTVQSLINRGMPFRWGVAPLVETENGARMARLYYYLLENFGSTETFAFLYNLAQRGTPLQALSPTVDWLLVRQAFDALMARKDDIAETVETDLDAILEGTEGDLEKQRAYAARLSTTLESAPQGHVFFNGKHFDLDDDFLRYLQTESAEHLQHLQFKVYKGELTEEDDVSTYFYDLPTTAKRRNMYIHPSPKAGSLRIFSLPDLIERNGLKSSAGSFVYPAESEQVPLTTYVVADFDNEESQQLVKEALLSTPGSLSRLSFIHNPASVSPFCKSDDFASPSRFLAQLVSWDLLSRLTPEQLLSALGLSSAEVSDDNGAQEPFSFDDIIGTKAFTGEDCMKYLTASRLVVRQLELKPGEQALVVNGRVVGPIQPGEFVAGDFETLAAYEHHKRVKSVYEALFDVYEPLKDANNREDAAEITAIASSIVSSIQLPDASEAGLFNAPQRPRLRNYQMLNSAYTAFSIGDNTTALYHFGVLVDPLSEAAQKWSSLFEWISEIPGVYVEFHINPTRYNELPLKRFYRYNLLPRLAFDDSGNEVCTKTTFTDLPVEPIYTLAMDTPQSWLIRPREALYDLDNIQLGMLSPQDRTRGIKAVFDLDYLVVEGHARESATNAPPRGLQLQLVTSNSTPIADTLVMANLGYLQFKTKPGVYRLEIRPGRGREIFKMESAGNEGWNSPSVEEGGDEVTVTSFEGVTLYPRLVRLPGMENVDVLQVQSDVHEETGFVENVMSKVSSLFGSKQKEEKALVPIDDGQAEINIFTVASGHLYERFASIMILSVLRHTKSTVKFWFIENFLSPSFLEFIPHFAAEYGFQYELITYKWPSWLRAQKEKQRIIWAYKILFLDVLFPMDLKKVIFVDADQIVRTDLKELVELDLHGAPYGYTPMGDDNPDTEGFRFWKTGYWKDFLRGRPYHISALYVVDLVRFRELAAGDMLRGHYQQLSADPNSLANLDQDLPNNLQREVPIFSLPEDWLWCETWCNKDRLHRAKTIDLCQNPLTKEPKLDRARQIPEWEVYDSEIAKFARRLREGEGSTDGGELPKRDEL